MAAAAAEPELASSLALLNTRHSDAHDLIDTQLSELGPELATQVSTQQLEPAFSNIVVSQGSVAHIGHIYQYYEAEKPPQLIPRTIKCGLCLGNSPKIDPALFQGRSAEIEKIRHQLEREDATGRRCLVLGGIGGIGKTQLALRYADCFRKSYDSVFWISASSETTLSASFREIAEIVFDGQSLGRLKDSQMSIAVRQWLSDVNNQRWLLIYDNYDDPDAYDITSFYPATDHGTIIVTTRLPQQVQGRELRVNQLEDIQDSLAILQSRSERSDTTTDACAYALAERVAGLPLALATAGTYLKTSSWTYQQYLEEYERRWNVNPRMPPSLPEYKNRTLYTTWDISYTRLRIQQPDAAQLLKLLAYFDNQELRYDHFKAGASNDLPDWLRMLATDPVEFENLMNILANQCFVEVRTTTQSYSIHAAVHDWILAALNEEIEPSFYRYAFACVGKSAFNLDLRALGHRSSSTVAMHAQRLGHEHLTQNPAVQIVLEENYGQTHRIGSLLHSQLALNHAEKMYVRVLAGCEKSLDHPLACTLYVLCELGVLFLSQNKIQKAEEMFVRVLTEKEKVSGLDLVSASAARYLGIVYQKQGELIKAEKIFIRALAESEEKLGHDHTHTLSAISDLGALYHQQGNLVRAEEMLVRTLKRQERAAGPNHASTLATVFALGMLYIDQGKLDEAQSMYERVLTEYENVLERDHMVLLQPIGCLAYVYRNQGKLDQAEQMFLRAIAGCEKAYGRDDISTLDLIRKLGNLYYDQKRFDKAEKMFFRALTGYEKAQDHASTLVMLRNLGLAYYLQGLFDKAEETFFRALTGYEKAQDHASTLDMSGYLGLAYYQQGVFDKAEETFLRALAGYEKEQDGHNNFTFHILHLLGIIYEKQGSFDAAADMFSQALSGWEKLLGSGDRYTKLAGEALKRVRHQIHQQSSEAESQSN